MVSGSFPDLCTTSDTYDCTDQFFPNAPAPPEIDEGSKTAVGKTAQSADEEPYTEEEDGPWYPGRAKEEFNRRRRGQNAEAASEEDDPVQVGWALPLNSSANSCLSGQGTDDMLRTNAREILDQKITSMGLCVADTGAKKR